MANSYVQRKIVDLSEGPSGIEKSGEKISTGVILNKNRIEIVCYSEKSLLPNNDEHGRAQPGGATTKLRFSHKARKEISEFYHW